MRLAELSIKGTAFGTAEVVDDRLRLNAGCRTDWFFPPDGRGRRDNVIQASMVTSEPVFTLSARVSVDFADTYDAGALFARTADDSWAKLAFEYSAEHRPTIVSVVTRGTSDDCDGPSLKSEHVWLRIHRNGRTLAFHYSDDGQFWHFARFFGIEGLDGGTLELGFGAQAPKGPGTVARFTDARFGTEAIPDLRNGQ